MKLSRYFCFVRNKNYGLCRCWLKAPADLRLHRLFCLFRRVCDGGGDLGDGEAVGRDCAAGGLFVYGLALGEELGDALVELLSVGVG